jgi:hypothetical protein
MAKNKTTTGLAKASGQSGKPSSAMPAVSGDGGNCSTACATITRDDSPTARWRIQSADSLTSCDRIAAVKTVTARDRICRHSFDVAQWQTKLVESLPKNLKGSLPTIKEIESELSKVPSD